MHACTWHVNTNSLVGCSKLVCEWNHQSQHLFSSSVCMYLIFADQFPCSEGESCVLLTLPLLLLFSPFCLLPFASFPLSLSPSLPIPFLSFFLSLPLTPSLPPSLLFPTLPSPRLPQLGHPGSVEVNPRHTFYVVNPRGDLPNTEKIFGKWFARQQGWRGVVGRAPTTQEYTTALEEHQLFV